MGEPRQLLYILVTKGNVGCRVPLLQPVIFYIPRADQKNFTAKRSNTCVWDWKIA